jgi:hypothetical protein
MTSRAAGCPVEESAIGYAANARQLLITAAEEDGPQLQANPGRCSLTARTAASAGSPFLE